MDARLEEEGFVKDQREVARILFREEFYGIRYVRNDDRMSSANVEGAIGVVRSQLEFYDVTPASGDEDAGDPLKMGFERRRGQPTFASGGKGEFWGIFESPPTE